MAGTSPDRSKRYESSTESTPGNEPPIRDTPDPRLSLSQDSTPKPDQATAVFSRRALLEAAEAAGLSLEETERGSGGGSAAAVDPDAGSDAAKGQRSGDSSGSVSGVATGSATGTDAGSDTGTGTAKPAGPETAGAEPDTGRADAADTEDSDEAGAPDAVSGDAGADADSGAADGPEGAAKGPGGSVEAPAEDEPSTGDDEAPEAGADAQDGDAGPDERGAAAPTRAAPAARLPAARAGEATPETDAEAQADATPEADAEPKTTTAPPSAADTRPEPEDEKPHGSAADAGSVVDGGKAADSAADTEPEPEDENSPRAAAAGVADPRAGVGARPGVAGAAADRSARGARGGSGAEGDEPDAADDGRAPQGSPAGDDESRTGGAGGKSDGDGGAEAWPAVDQPTAIFRAPRPPAVDQPTTMLKLGDAATRPAKPGKAAESTEPAETTNAAEATSPSAPTNAAAEPAEATKPAPPTKPAEATSPSAPANAGAAKSDSDEHDPAPPAERTSKFVALKPLDETAPPKPPATAPDDPAVSPAEATRAIPQVGPELTTQQPLPPRPPLDLLAELTNTPPPRQTPVRTLVRRVKIWTPLVILLAIVFAVAQAVRPLPAPTLTLTADASYAFEGEKVSLPWPDEGQGWMDVNGIGTMDSFGDQKPVAIGSVAKAMTAYVILKEHPMKPGAKGATIPVDEKAEIEGGYDKDGKGESTLNTVKEGDQLSQYDAIAAIMIPSANNIARLLARWDSNGSEAEFVKKMNAAAKDLGMTNTKYTDPSGLKETTVSTAEDQVKLGNALVKIKALTDITRLPSWKDPSGQPWRNYNNLVPFDNAIGIKTGSTSAAGGNLLFAATKEVGGETVIVVGAILGQHTPPIIDTVNAVSKTAMLAAQDAVISDTILKKGDVVGYVDDGLGGQTPVVVTKNVSAVGWSAKTVKLELDASKTIAHEAKSGTEVGSLIVGDGSGDGVEVPVALQKDLTEPGFLTKLTRVS